MAKKYKIQIPNFEFTFSNLLLVDLLFVDEPGVLVQGVGVVQAEVPGLEKSYYFHYYFQSSTGKTSTFNVFQRFFFCGNFFCLHFSRFCAAAGKLTYLRELCAYAGVF